MQLYTTLLVAFLLLIPAAASAAETPSDEHPPPRIEIEKTARKLRWIRDTVHVVYPVGLGFEPVADKQRQGDGATPEGDYFVCIKNPHSQYLLSLGINYPNSVDAARGLETGLISKAEHDRIVRAEKRGVCPPWNTRLGGEIFIHGRGAGSDWTLGCVALDDDAMRTLFAEVEVGTPVHIAP